MLDVVLNSYVSAVFITSVLSDILLSFFTSPISASEFRIHPTHQISFLSLVLLSLRTMISLHSAFLPPASLPASSPRFTSLTFFQAPLRPSVTSCLSKRAVFDPITTVTNSLQMSSEQSPSSPSSVRLQPTTRDSNWRFFDVARVLVRGGRGGNGVVAFRREKCVPRGGPAGGTGGSGGSVNFAALSSGNTLSSFRRGAAFRADSGANGSGKCRHGVSAPDITISVPIGTVVKADDGRILADLSHYGDSFCAARGGRGGRGNAAFKTERNRAPRICEQGEPGMERWLRLELKLVADVGLVGFPNAGKSTVLDAVSNARPKIADYPFTTIVPNLGVVDGIEGADGLVIADVPGLIDGAHRGIGMGLAFLRHVERCKLIVHIVDGSEPNLVDRYHAIRRELELFDSRLTRKKEVILVNKADLPGVRDEWNRTWRSKLVEAANHKRIAIVSAKSKEGLSGVMRKLHKLVESIVVEDDIVVLGDEDNLDEEPATVDIISEGVFKVAGFKVKKAFDLTNWDYVEGIDRFQRILEALGVNRMLIKAGAKDGDTIVCFDREFDYYKNENIYSAAAALDGYLD